MTAVTDGFCQLVSPFRGRVARSSNAGRARVPLCGASGRNDESAADAFSPIGADVTILRRAKTATPPWASLARGHPEKGKAYGVVTAKALAVLEALLWAFHVPPRKA